MGRCSGTFEGDCVKWYHRDDVIYTANSENCDTALVGISKGAARNELYGNRKTHINLGVACTTGVDGENYAYCTIGGGYWNVVKHNGGTIGGDSENTVTDEFGTVSGGFHNTADSLFTTVSGGQNNIASKGWSTVSGGLGNEATSLGCFIGGGEGNSIHDWYSVIVGGQNNSVDGQYSFAFGNGVNVVGNYRAVFFDNVAPGRFGVNVESPRSALEVNGEVTIGNGTATVGHFYTLPNTDGDDGQVLITDGSGNVSWGSVTAAPDNDWQVSGSDMYSIPSGNVGIGTISPGYKLDVNGNASIDGSTFIVDDVNHRVGIGTLAPGHPLHVETAARFPLLGVAYFKNTASTSAHSAVYAECPECKYGGYFAGRQNGVYGKACIAIGGGPTAYIGVGGIVDSDDDGIGRGYGVMGDAGGGEYNYGVWGRAAPRISAPSATTNCGVRGGAVGGRDVTNAIGVFGTASGGVSATMNNFGGWGDIGVIAAGHYAGYFTGNVNITGDLTKGSGAFLIDHPLDPLNKTLRHNFVESPENLCLYRGKVTLNGDGITEVQMPDYFAALTKEDEATVTLTPIGEYSDLWYEWNEDYTVFIIHGNPESKVSYLVLAARDDPVIRELQQPVETNKGEDNGWAPGKLLYPKAYGYPEEMGQNWETLQQLRKDNSE